MIQQPKAVEEPWTNAPGSLVTVLNRKMTVGLTPVAVLTSPQPASTAPIDT